MKHKNFADTPAASVQRLCTHYREVCRSELQGSFAQLLQRLRRELPEEVNRHSFTARSPDELDKQIAEVVQEIVAARDKAWRSDIEGGALAVLTPHFEHLMHDLEVALGPGNGVSLLAGERRTTALSLAARLLDEVPAVMVLLSPPPPPLIVYPPPMPLLPGWVETSLVIGKSIARGARLLAGGPDRYARQRVLEMLDRVFLQLPENAATAIERVTEEFFRDLEAQISTELTHEPMQHPQGLSHDG